MQSRSGNTTHDNAVAFEAAVATLEADGASPTQAHVAALRVAWDTLQAGLAGGGRGNGGGHHGCDKDQDAPGA